MTKRVKRNLIIAVIFIITIIVAITTLKTFAIGFQLWSFSNDVVESERYANYHPIIRESANEVAKEVETARNALYNAGGYTQWLCELSKATSVLVGITLLALTIIFGNISWNIIKRLAKVRG